MEYSILPHFLQVELTYNCNSNCMFCYNPLREKITKHESIVAILRKVDSYRLNHVQLTGGEVTLSSSLSFYLSLLENTKWKSIVTNGKVFQNNCLDFFDEVYLSLHGDKQTHETMTQSKDSYEIIITNIKKYINAGKIVNCDTVITKKNYDKLYELAENAEDLGMKSIFFNIYQDAGLGSTNSNGLSLSLNEFKRALDNIIAIKKELKIVPNFGTSTPFCLDERLLTEGLAFTCGAGNWFAAINPEGELRICNQSIKSYGNILIEDLGTIWNKNSLDKDYRQLSWITSDTPCSNCKFSYYCLAGCRINDNGDARVDPMVIANKGNVISPNYIDELIQKNRTAYNTVYKQWQGL